MEDYIKDFFQELATQMDKISWKEIARATKILHSTYENDGKVYLIGNGGSAAIATHFTNDLNKTVFGQKGEKNVKRFQATSLVDNTSALTAWANDVGFESVFSEQLKNFSQEKDALIAISSSGNSPNIIKAVETAKNLHLPIISLTGFDGGKLISLSDAKIHIPSSKYAIIESAHEAICHLITTYFEELL
jgi:D-sedoheptulose 7-phosphate isomerase